MRAIWTLLVFLTCNAEAWAHGVSESHKVTALTGGIIEFIWLGAIHMLTGYDHLLFLFGVMFFLTSFRDILWFVTAFTLGHSITLVAATFAGLTANAYLVDAIIALTVIYKGFDNIDGFKRFLKIQAPNLLAMVFIFGLIHGFGLSTRLQELALDRHGLFSKILAFNLGVELGQVAALVLILGFLKFWRKSSSFEALSRWANYGLMLAGLFLFAMQLGGYQESSSQRHGGEGLQHNMPMGLPKPIDRDKFMKHHHGDDGHGHDHSHDHN